MDLVSRVKNILVDPVNEWRVIDGESGDGGTLLKNYVAFLAAIPAVCGFIGSVMIGGRIFTGLVGAIIGLSAGSAERNFTAPRLTGCRLHTLVVKAG